MLIVQRVVRNFIDLDVRPYVGPRPPDQWIHFHQFKCLIPLDQPGVGSGRRLLPSDARDPCIISLEDACERFDFAQLATAVRIARPQGLAMLIPPAVLV